MRYSKQHDKIVTWIENSATTPCILSGSFGTDYYDPTASGWSSSFFIIGQIEDANDPATTYTFTVTGIGARSGGINGFQVNLTHPSEFDSPSKDIRIVLSATKSLGILQSDSTIAKINGFGTIVNNFKCGAIKTNPINPNNPTCTGVTKYLDVRSNTCVSACGSKHIGLSSVNSYLCVTPSECIN